jgi:hypothetical protein
MHLTIKDVVDKHTTFAIISLGLGTNILPIPGEPVYLSTVVILRILLLLVSETYKSVPTAIIPRG